MMDRVRTVLEGAKTASNIPMDQIDAVELVGGASRVPWWKQMCSQAFGGKELSTTMNADESVARGCALQAAILSPLYKVRDFKVEDTTCVGVSISWLGTAVDPAAPEASGDTPMLGGDGPTKVANMFPAGSMMNMLKLITFYRKEPFEIKAQFGDDGPLLPKSNKELGSYTIQVPPQPENRKIKVQAKITLNGTFTIEKAQMVIEEEYEETVKERREVGAPAEGEAKPEGEKVEGAAAEGEQKADEEKKFEMVDVVKKKIRLKRTDLNVVAKGRPGLSPELLQKMMDHESKMQSEMKDIIEADEKRNDLESYIFNMRDKIAESG
jgi:heat shock protein 4